MITIAIKTDGKQVADKLDLQGATLEEVSILIYKMEQVKLHLLQIPFPQEVQVHNPLCSCACHKIYDGKLRPCSSCKESHA